MPGGWVKLHRSVMDNVLWQDKPFARGQAWIDLIMLASHKDTEILFDGKYLQLKRGELVTSTRKLSERWGWSRTKTTRFLDELKKSHMLNVNRDTKKTTIQVLNYEKYQGFADEAEIKKATKKATEKPQKDTFNNINNIKKEKEIKNKEKDSGALPCPDEEDDDFDPVWEDPKVSLERFRKEQGR